MIIHPHTEQGTEGWLAARRGRPSASRFKDIITAKTGALSASSRDYMAELIGETFCPEWTDFAGNKFTDRGTELEPDARAAYEELTGYTVTEVGFITRVDGIVGCSPDGLIACTNNNWSHGVELKCPAPKTHIGWMADGVLPDAHKQQVHGSMAVTGLMRWDFMSYFPGLKPFLITVIRDDYTTKISNALDQFLTEYQKMREEMIPKLKLTK